MLLQSPECLLTVAVPDKLTSLFCETMKWLCFVCKLRNEPPVITTKSQKASNFSDIYRNRPFLHNPDLFWVRFYSFIRNDMSTEGNRFTGKKVHFFAFSFKPAIRSCSSTVSRFYNASSNVRLYTITSSMYIKQMFHWSPASTVSISRSKVAVALHNPKGRTRAFRCCPSCALKRLQQPLDYWKAL